MSLDPDRAHAQQLLQAGRWKDARPVLERLHAALPADRTLLHALCDAEIADGAAESALARIEALDHGADTEAAFLRARALTALGRIDAAREAFHALRARLPHGSFALEMHLAAAESRAGDPAAALAALDRAAALDPRSPVPHAARADLLAAQGDADGSRAALQEAVSRAPADAPSLLRLARAEAAAAHQADVAALLQRAKAAGPRTAGEWLDIARLHVDGMDWRSTAEALAHASRLAPQDAAIAVLEATAQVELGEIAAAERALARAAPAAATDLPFNVLRRLLLPPIYASEDDLGAWRARYAEGLAALQAEAGRWRDDASQVFRVNRSNFLLAYQGRDDRALQQGYSSFLASLADVAAPELRERPVRTFEGGRRLRVGFASSFFRECTIGHYFERWITGLDPARFERFVYSTGGIADDFTRRLGASVDRFTLLRGGPLDAARRIRADTLDVLVYPEIGMDSSGYLLATLRLAPVQLAGWGHPVTTGSDAIDGYLTVSAMEPADGAAHYVEPLVALPGVGVDYPMPARPPAMARENFGLPAAARLYACPQSLFKIHPAMDDTFARIAAEDPQGVLVFFQGTAPALTQRFGERLQRAFARAGVPPRNQVKFLPRLDAPHFRALLARCDVVLDTFHWSGGNTSFDAFAAGTPVVTLPGAFMRGRQTAAMLRSMDLATLVAESPQGYLAKALEVARDRDTNAEARARIAARREGLFGQREAVAALGERLMALGGGG